MNTRAGVGLVTPLVGRANPDGEHLFRDPPLTRAVFRTPSLRVVTGFRHGVAHGTCQFIRRKSCRVTEEKSHFGRCAW